MKKTVKRVFVMSMLLVGLMTYASPVNPKSKSTVKVESLSSKRFSLRVKTLHENMNVQIKDVNGTTVYSETLKEGYSYRKTYDVSELPSGTYYIKISDSKYTKVYSVSNKKVVLIEDIRNESLQEKRELLAVLTSL